MVELKGWNMLLEEVAKTERKPKKVKYIKKEEKPLNFWRTDNRNIKTSQGVRIRRD